MRCFVCRVQNNGFYFWIFLYHFIIHIIKRYAVMHVAGCNFNAYHIPVHFAGCMCFISHSDGHSVVKQRDAAPNHAFDKVCFLIKATLTAWLELSNFRCKDFLRTTKSQVTQGSFLNFKKGKLPRKVKEPHVT